MAAFSSIASGNWNDGPTTWGTGAGVYPGSAQAGDTVTINGGHAVLENVVPTYTVATVLIKSHASTPGKLYFANGTSGALTVTTSISGDATGAVLGQLIATSDGNFLGPTVTASNSSGNLMFTGSTLANGTQVYLSSTGKDRKSVV